MRRLLVLLLSFFFFLPAIAKTKHSGKHHYAKKHNTAIAKKKYESILIKHNPPVVSNNDTTKVAANGIVDNLLTVLEQELGKPYSLGSNGPHGFDCSGLIKFAFSFIGITLPRTAADIGRLGQKIALDELQPGDLLFFTGRRNCKSKNIGHVGCVYKVDSGKVFMIHSSHEGVNILDISNSEYYQQRLMYAKRLFDFDSCNYSMGKF